MATVNCHYCDEQHFRRKRNFSPQSLIKNANPVLLTRTFVFFFQSDINIDGLSGIAKNSQFLKRHTRIHAHTHIHLGSGMAETHMAWSASGVLLPCHHGPCACRSASTRGTHPIPSLPWLLLSHPPTFLTDFFFRSFLLFPSLWQGFSITFLRMSIGK